MGSKAILIALSMICTSEVPWTARAEASSSYSTSPSAYTSLRRSSGWARICSGDMYAYLPLIIPVRVWCVAVAAFAMPKSISFTVPAVPRRMFCGLTSRCTRPSGAPSVVVAPCA